MKTLLKRFIKDESGVTALETAIILIAFVVVAAIFAFTILSTGTFLTEKSKEAAYAGLQEVSSAMELKGSMILKSSGATIVFTLATVTGGTSVDLSKLSITYRDDTTNTTLTYDTGATAPVANHWIATDAAGNTATTILSQGSLAQITIQAPASITANQSFSIEVKPPVGGVMEIQRTAPAQINGVTDLH